MDANYLIIYGQPLIGDIWIYAGRMSLRLVIALLRSASCSSMFYLTRVNPEIGPWHTAECKALSINQSVKQKVLRPKLQNRLCHQGRRLLFFLPYSTLFFQTQLQARRTYHACLRYCVYQSTNWEQSIAKVPTAEVSKRDAWQGLEGSSSSSSSSSRKWNLTVCWRRSARLQRDWASPQEFGGVGV